MDKFHFPVSKWNLIANTIGYIYNVIQLHDGIINWYYN